MYRRIANYWNPIRLLEKEFVYRVQDKFVVGKDEVFPEVELVSKASFNLHHRDFRL